VLDYAWIIPLLPAASFFLILFFGKRLPRKGSEIGIAAVGLAFVLALVVNVDWYHHVDDAGAEGGGEHAAVVADGESASVAAPAQEGGGGEAAAEATHETVEPVTKEVTWFENGGIDIKVGMLLDGPAVMMLLLVTLVSLLVHVYSTDYVHGDRRYTHFFAFLSLFTASMLGLVIAKTTIQLICMWELVGVCSFVLIGHWWEEKANSDAALKAFITNRVGDVGLIVGVIILFWTVGSFDILRTNAAALDGTVSHTALLVASCCLIAAVMSKSGQFVLHTWLPDAMAGPTPVSALIHAATMVVAGIYMVGRLYAVFFEGLSIGVSSFNLLALVGAVTVLGGAGLAFVQNDIKKVLAYSTVSQLGYMVMALGVGAWTAAFFHLFTHAFFKACLFLGSGSVSHAVHSFDMRDMGGLRKWMPQTYKTFVIASAALIGLFPLAGFWSKDEILAGASQLGGAGNYKVFMVVGIAGALMTAAYMTRVIYLTFFGEFRSHGHPHESGPRITVPLWILAVLGVTAGLANLPSALSPDSTALRFEHYFEPKGAYFPTVHFAHPEFSLGIAVASTIIGLVGITLAYLWYWRDAGPHGITARSRVARGGYTVLVNKYYFDRLYTDMIVGSIKGPVARATYWVNQNIIDGIVNGAGQLSTVLGRFVYERIDQQVVDGVVNGSAEVAEGGGQVFRKLTSGKVQQYGALLFGAAAVFAGVFIIFV
jgi:NADH-quinone oxidoreductase subunit L